MPAFEPIISRDAEILILGSMPGETSLDKAEYYAHPRNSFWWIMASFFGFDVTLAYQQRCGQLIHNKVALWDVLHDCSRPGSLDSNIVTASEVPNDFKRLLTTHTSINTIVFNGAAAERIFYRYNKQLVMHFADAKRIIRCVRCPSTSPAHASMNKYEKLVSWSNALNNS